MWNGFCGDLIRRTNNRLLLLVLATAAGLIFFFGFNLAYFTGFFTGPRPATNSELRSASGASSFRNSIVKLHGGVTSNAKLAEYSKDDSHPDGYVSARYLTTDVGGKLLLIRVSPYTPLAQDSVDPSQTLPEGDFTGQAHAFNSKMAALVSNANQMGGNYLPYYVDAYDYKAFGWFSSIICGLLALWAAYGALRYMQRNANPAEHPFAKSVARFGALESIVPQLDAEMSAAHSTFTYRANVAEVTANWYVTTSYLGAKASHLSSLVWIFRKIVKRRVYFVIPAGTQQSLVSLDRFGQRAVVQLKALQIDGLISLLRNVAPKAVYGYDKRLNKLWRAGRKSADRIAFTTEAQTMLAGQQLPEAMVARKYS